jgi:hypothetical protein
MNVALPCPPTLDGVHLTAADTALWTIRPRTLKGISESATGIRREAYVYQGVGYPEIRRKSEITLAWESLGSMRETVEELLAAPGPHTLILWRFELLTWRGDGSRAEFFLPWTPALEITQPPANGPAPAAFAPRVRVTLAGTVLTPLDKDSTAYAAGTPAAGEVWFLTGLSAGRKFKLNSAPASGALVYAWIVPALEVFEGAEHEQRFSGPIREPRDLELLER